MCKKFKMAAALKLSEKRTILQKLETAFNFKILELY